MCEGKQDISSLISSYTLSDIPGLICSLKDCCTLIHHKGTRSCITRHIKQLPELTTSFTFRYPYRLINHTTNVQLDMYFPEITMDYLLNVVMRD